ncbi:MULTISPECIES: hypothetical protein [unclassified Flavobacterium]|uniref:hypothetical protein n=1 Tax=unclassified Flavobacterium TaxID=196869 RepID=UPI00131D2DFA|nr:hypothetical protein [Flavobacterium sp. I-STPA6A]
MKAYSIKAQNKPSGKIKKSKIFKDHLSSLSALIFIKVDFLLPLMGTASFYNTPFLGWYKRYSVQQELGSKKKPSTYADGFK